ncbi:alpha/beta hydrolase [Salinispira pacifica]|uniref:alpha/beta hydrolase n=1 Tax=Salinispira pacifica TaxID=1307761 RepID=UPI00146FC6EB|nr:alpha/beta hydrolase [Salinispira pacifica]
MISIGMVLVIMTAGKSIITPSGDIHELVEEAKNMPVPRGGVHSDIRYGSRNFRNLKLDLYEPTSANPEGNAPLVVFYHGGSWVYGDKTTIRIIHRFLDRMREAGYFVASVNYTAGLLGGFHAPLKNSVKAVRWLREHSSRYGYDPDSIALYGISAGGHIALMTETRFRDSGCIQMVLAECAPSDLVEMARGDAFGSSQYMDMIPDSYLRRHSPVEYVSEDMAPVLIYHGDADTIVHVDQARILHDAVRAVGAHSELEIYEDGTHAFLGMSDELWYQQETRALKFMREQLGG